MLAQLGLHSFSASLYQNSGLVLVKFFDLTILTYQLFTEMNESVLRDFFQASDECLNALFCALFISLNNVNEECMRHGLASVKGSQYV